MIKPSNSQFQHTINKQIYNFDDRVYIYYLPSKLFLFRTKKRNMFLKLELAILSVLAFLISHSYQAIIEAHLARNGRAHIKPICINPHLRVNSLYRIPPRRGLARRPQNEAFPSIPCLVSLANQAKGHQVALKSSEEQQEIKNKINQPTFQQLICDIAKIAKLEILYLTKNGTEIGNKIDRSI